MIRRRIVDLQRPAFSPLGDAKTKLSEACAIFPSP